MGAFRAMEQVEYSPTIQESNGLGPDSVRVGAGGNWGRVNGYPVPGPEERRWPRRTLPSRRSQIPTGRIPDSTGIHATMTFGSG